MSLMFPAALLLLSFPLRCAFAKLQRSEVALLYVREFYSAFFDRLY